MSMADGPTPCSFCEATHGHTHELIDIEKVDGYASLIDDVAQAIVNADIDSIGGAWPWPSGDAEWEIRVREEAREAARVAIKAFLGWKGHHPKKVFHTNPLEPKF